MGLIPWGPVKLSRRTGRRGQQHSKPGAAQGEDEVLGVGDPWRWKLKGKGKDGKKGERGFGRRCRNSGVI